MKNNFLTFKNCFAENYYFNVNIRNLMNYKHSFYLILDFAH